MSTRTQTDSWIYRVVVVLGLIVIASTLSLIAQAVFFWPVTEFPGVLGVVALAGLARLLISPLNRGLYG